MILRRVRPFYNPSTLRSSPPVNGFRSNFVYVLVDKFMTQHGSYIGLKTESKSNHCYFSMHTALLFFFTTTHYGQDKYKNTVHTKHKTNFTNEREGVWGVGTNKKIIKKNISRSRFMRLRKSSEHDC
jgi:hypothetical protein